MKKIVVATLLVAAAIIGTAWMQRASFVSHAIANATRMEATVSDVTLFPLTLENLKIHDPVSETDLHIDTLIVEAPIRSLFSNPIHINTLTIRGIALQSKLGGLNIHKPESFLQLLQGSPEKADIKASPGKKISIDTLKVEKVDLQVSNPFSKKEESIRLRVPEFTVKNPGELTGEELLQLIKRRLTTP